MCRLVPTNLIAKLLLSALLSSLATLCFLASGAGDADFERVSSLSSPAEPRRSHKPLLRTDGTLAPASGFRGGIDARGCQLVSGPMEAPRFELGCTAGTGDEGWGDECASAGIDGTVNPLVVDGGGNLYAGGRFTTAGG